MATGGSGGGQQDYRKSVQQPPREMESSTNATGQSTVSGIRVTAVQLECEAYLEASWSQRYLYPSAFRSDW